MEDRVELTFLEARVLLSVHSVYVRDYDYITRVSRRLYFVINKTTDTDERFLWEGAKSF